MRKRISWGDKWVNRAPLALLENPFELFTAFFALMVGIPYALGVVRVGSVSALLPLPFVRVWGGCMAVGGFLVVVGLWKRWYHVELAGLGPLSVGAFIYDIAIIYRGGVRALESVAVLTAFTLATISRMFLLQTLDRVDRKVRANGME